MRWALTPSRRQTRPASVPRTAFERGEAGLPPYAGLPAEHPLAVAGRSLGLQQRAAGPFILLDLPLSREYFMSLFHAHGVAPRIAWRSRSHEFVRGPAASGQGFAIHDAVPCPTTTRAGRALAVSAFVETACRR